MLAQHPIAIYPTEASELNTPKTSLDVIWMVMACFSLHVQPMTVVVMAVVVMITGRFLGAALPHLFPSHPYWEGLPGSVSHTAAKSTPSFVFCPKKFTCGNASLNRDCEIFHA
jgi:hypothetical protein